MSPTLQASVAERQQEQLLTSQEAYLSVMTELSPLVGEHSLRRNDFYGRMGIEVVQLEPARCDVRGHRGFISDQTGQPSGAYKSRGMANAAMAAVERAAETGQPIKRFHIASAGNAGLGLAIAGQRLGVATTVECIAGVSKVKRGKLLVAGATVSTGHGLLEEAMETAELAGTEPGHVTIRPFDQAEVVAGQATVGLETLADLLAQHQRGEIDVRKDQVKLFVPIGGGGLIAGIACVVKWAKEQGLIGPNVQVIGVQMEGCDAMKRYVDYVQAGLTPPDDLFNEGLPFNGKSDGTAVRQPGKLTRAIVADPEFVASIVTVSEGELGEAMLALSRRHGKLIEPAAALSMAGAKQYAAAHPAVDRRFPDRKETLVTFTTGASVTQELFDEFGDKAEERRRTLDAERREQAAAYVVALYSLPRVRQRRTRFNRRSGTQVVHAPAAHARATAKA